MTLDRAENDALERRLKAISLVEIVMSVVHRRMARRNEPATGLRYPSGFACAGWGRFAHYSRAGESEAEPLAAAREDH